MSEVVTIASLAAELGVSTATVAKALHGQGRISAEMVARVRALARERRYVPNISARSLRTNLKDAVGLLITGDITNPWYSRLTSELEERFAQQGLTMLLALGKGSDERVLHAQENFFGGRVRGLICGPIITRQHMEVLRPTLDRQLPLVIFSNLEELPVNFVSLEQEVGARIMLEHLHGLGHRRICYLGSPNRDQWRVPRTRALGYTAFMEGRRLPPDYLVLPEQSRRAAFDGTIRMLGERPRQKLPTALFCHNDDVALGALLALQQAGMKVPQEISVTGFDDIAEASLWQPGLTTIGGVMETMATELVKALEASVQGGQPPYQSFIIPKLILRSTTTFPRRDK